MNKTKIYIIGPMSQADRIREIGEYFNSLDDYEVRYVQPQPDRIFSALVLEYYTNIQWADEIFAITKPDGGIGEGVVYEIVYAYTLGKSVLKVKPGWNDVHHDSCNIHGNVIPPDGMWVDWKDSAGNVERARMKYDIFDYFYPETKMIKEENIIAWRLPTQRKKSDTYEK